MSLSGWKRIENEAGYPCYIDDTSGQQHYDHPHFSKIMETLAEYNGIKYSVYRIAYKIFALQRQLRVPPLRISTGVFARHQLSLSESSLSLDASEMESVLADIYFAAEKEGLYSGDIDLAVDLLINLILNVYDRERKEPIRVLAAKTLLILLSDESLSDKWQALANSCADHNGCVSPRRLATLLTYIVALPDYLGDQCDQLQTDVDNCFAKSAGMLGVSARAVSEWGAVGCASARWLAAACRLCAGVGSASDVPHAGAGLSCARCGNTLLKVLRFKCSKCSEVYFCDKCYLYDRDLTSVSGHKTTHLVHEVIDGEKHPSECLSIMKGMKRFFFCTKTKKKKMVKKGLKKSTVTERVNSQSCRRKRDGKPAIFTSTVGKASGNGVNNPTSLLQDIITQLETQNKALQELSTQLRHVAKGADDELKAQVDLNWTQISTQIHRLKILKENLSQNPPLTTENHTTDKQDRPQAFDLFSPIPVIDDKQSKVDSKTQPRVLSLDSGNFSVVSKHTDTQNLLTMTGDSLKPVVVHATSDSISTVSMNDISSWYNDKEQTANQHRPLKQVDSTTISLSATEQKYDADIKSVETSNDKMKELNADLDTVLDRLQQILTFAMDESCFDNSQLRETANEMEGLLGTLIRGVEQRATLNATKGML